MDWTSDSVCVLVILWHHCDERFHSDSGSWWLNGQSRDNYWNVLHRYWSVARWNFGAQFLSVQTTDAGNDWIFGDLCHVHHCDGDTGWFPVSHRYVIATILDFRKCLRFYGN